MFQRNKGEYGYISKVKKMDIVKMLIYVAIDLAIFVVGLFLNQMSHKNIFTVIAVLFVLPWARIFVEFILLFPYQTPAREDYTKIASVVSGEQKLLSDVVITSEQKAMGLSFVVLGKGYIFALAMNEKQNVKYIQNYLQTGVRNRSDAYQVAIYTSLEQLMKAVKTAKTKEIADTEQETVEEYVMSLIV